MFCAGFQYVRSVIEDLAAKFKGGPAALTLGTTQLKASYEAQITAMRKVRSELGLDVEEAGRLQDTLNSKLRLMSSNIANSSADVERVTQELGANAARFQTLGLADSEEMVDMWTNFAKNHADGTRNFYETALEASRESQYMLRAWRKEYGRWGDDVVKSIMNVVNAADSITHKDLNVRIKDETGYDEMKTLIRSFNIMIERLEGSFNHINEFSSHAAHELKTPLTIMKGELELSMRKLLLE